jgi:thioredoxin-like negative regulator of GroEL
MHIRTLDSFIHFIRQQEYVIVFFEGKNCRVCHDLYPKIKDLVEREFPSVPLVVVNTDESPDIAGQHIVFSLPVLLVFKQEREVSRISGKQPVFQIAQELRNSIRVDYGDYFSAFEEIKE